jgi:hypothetical protein
MCVKPARQGVNEEADPGSQTTDELDDYIRYQDEVLERNANELRGIVEDQEKQMEAQQEEEDQRMKNLYEREDPMEGIDERLQQSIQRTDDMMGQRMAVMDRRTDEYMKELAIRNAQWTTRMKQINRNIARFAREKGDVSWDERQDQKEGNRDYVPSYSYVEAEGEIVLDAQVPEAVAVSGSSGQEGWEEMTPGEQQRFIRMEQQRIRKRKQQQAKAKKRPAKKKTTSKPGSRRPPQKAKTVGQTARKPSPKKKTEKPTARKPVPKKRPEYKVGISQARQRSTVAGTSTDRSAKAAPKRTSGPKSYPCPTCQNPLAFYDKYQRWWCRTCKKWR